MWDNMDEPWGPYAKWANSDRNRYYTYYLHMAPKKVTLTETESQMVVAGAGEWGRWGGVRQSSHMSGWKMNEFGGLIMARL